MNLRVHIDKYDMKDKSKLRVQDVNAVDIDRFVRRGEDSKIKFGEDIARKEKRIFLKDVRLGTHEELRDHKGAKQAMKDSGSYDAEAANQWKATAKQLRSG